MNITVALMVKNEKTNLEETIPFFKKNFSEIVIVDTGSTDGTIELLDEHQINYKRSPWNYNFSEVRNKLLEMATGDYILMLDADERIDELFIQEMHRTIDDEHNVYEVKILNITDKEKLNMTHINLRLFKNDGQFYYDGNIHEQLIHPVPFKAKETNLLLKHYGYTAEVVRKKGKRKRNMRILDLELKKDPNHPFHNFNMSNELIPLKKYNEALLHLKKAAKHGKGTTYERDIYRNILHCLIEMNRVLEAEEISREAINRFKKDSRFHFITSKILLKQGRVEDAEYEMKLGLGSFLKNGETVDGTENVFLLFEMMKISKRKRNYEDILKINDVLLNWLGKSADAPRELIKLLMSQHDEDSLYTYITERFNEEKLQNLMFVEFRVKKGLKEISMNKLLSDEGRILKLWESSKYEQILKEIKIAEPETKLKLEALLFSLNLDRNKPIINEYLEQNKTLKAISEFISGKEIKKINYDGKIYLLVIEEIIKTKKIEIFSKVIQMFHYFPIKDWLKIAELMDEYYFDDTAIEFYTRYLLKAPNDYKSWVRASELLFTQGKWDDCILFAGKASEIRSDNMRPIELMILSLEEKAEKQLVNEIISQLKNTITHSQFLKNRER